MPTRANKRSGLVFVLQVNRITSTWSTSMCSARLSPQRLVSLPLLILVAASLTTIHSESFQLQKFPSFLRPPNQTQMQYTNYDSPLSASSEIPTISPVSSIYNSFVSSTIPPDFSNKIASEAGSPSSSTDVGGEKHFVLIHNNNKNHTILVQENTPHQQPHQQDFYMPKPQIQQNLVDKFSTEKSSLKIDERVAGEGFDQQMQHQYVAPEFNEKPIIAETNFENTDPQSRKPNFSPLFDAEQVATQETFNQLENLKFSDAPKDLDDSGHKILEKRFGFFKKGQQGNNNNLPNFGAVSFYDDCERCLNNAGLGSTQTASWMLDSTSPVTYRQHQQLSPAPQLVYPVSNYPFTQPYMQHSRLFKNKFNKYLLQKPRNIGDYNFPKSFSSSYKYKPSLHGRIAYRAQLNQPLNCIQPANLAGLGQPMNPCLPDHFQLDDTKIPPQTSYLNLMY